VFGCVSTFWRVSGEFPLLVVLVITIGPTVAVRCCATSSRATSNSRCAPGRSRLRHHHRPPLADFPLR
jgi:hypothetical protein